MSAANNTVLFSGYAKVPQNAPNHDHLREVSCVIEVDMDTKTIVNCEFGRLKPLTNDFLKRMIIGYDLSQGLDALVANIKKRCQLVSKNAIIKTLEICYQKYVDYK